MSLNRRDFIKTAAISAPAMTLPGSLSARDIEKFESEIGKSKWELDSPALCVDLNNMVQNINKVHNSLKGTKIGVRPHAKTHKCPAIASMQIQAGALGICVAKLSEAEVFLNNGVKEVLMTGVNVSPSKIKKAMELRRKHEGFIQAVDNIENAGDLQLAAKEAGITADVVVDIDVIKRSGVLPGASAVELAKLVDKSPNLKFRGILAYDGAVQHVNGFSLRKAQALKTFEPVVATYLSLKSSGLNIEIFSGGGTGTYNIYNDVPGFTDLQVGSYVFMDGQYMSIGGKNNDTVYDDFIPSLTVMTTIVNANHPGKITTDSGAKALTINKPNPAVVGEPSFEYSASSDEYGSITFQKSNKTYKVGDKLEVIVPHCDPVVNLFNVMYGIRKDKVVSVLPILARGKSQ